MSTWKPTEGMRRAELLVQVLETEAAAAESKISAVFRHRMVEQIGKVIDAALPPPVTIPDGTIFANGRIENGGLHQTVMVPAAASRFDDEAIHADAPKAPPAAAPVKTAKPAKPGKKTGKRGRPSKAELAARAAAQA